MGTALRQFTVWGAFWSWAGRVPLRQKIMGIIVAPLLILGLTIAWWVSNQLGGWLSYLLSEERVAQAMGVGMRSVALITFAAALLGLGIGSFLTWFLTRPLLDMTFVARKVKDGDLSIRAPVWASDEIGELGRAFNDMIASLDASYRELERSNTELVHRNQELAVLYQLADMASKSFAIDDVASAGLRQAMTNVGASAGLIVLFAGEDLSLCASQGLPDEFVDAARECLPTYEFEHDDRSLDWGGLVVVAVEQQTHRAPELAEQSRKLGKQTLLLAPIHAQAGRLGMLVLLHDDPYRASQLHRQLVSGICNQIGVTVQNYQLWEELRRKERLRLQLLNKVVSAQEEERQRISRELHDETGQALTSLLVQLKILEQSGDVTDIHARVSRIRQLTQQTLQEVRRLAAALRPAALDDLGLVSALEGYIYDYAGKSSIAVDFQTHHMDDVRLPRDMEIVLYRVIQESLTNVLRHAEAKHVDVMIAREGSTVRASVKDDGRGFDADTVMSGKERGLGLLGMQERIELLGGRFHLQSGRGRGTRIDVELDVPEGELVESRHVG
ncbi:MAG: HAMP domain-containing protein [Chloroflexi bacterium]|nr:HAMP domain-containing protein [Chloroflexota bacterium]